MNKIEIDYEQLEYLASIQCTLDEIAGFFKVSKDTIRRRIKEKYKIYDDDGNEIDQEMTFESFFEIYGATGRVSVRRKQFSVAMKGDRGMLIWLGKQWLNQKDNMININNTNALTNRYAQFNDKELEELADAIIERQTPSVN